MTLIHLITNKVYPTPGGLERSIIDTARLLAELPETGVIVYARWSGYRIDERQTEVLGIPVIKLYADHDHPPGPYAEASMPREERFRTDYLQLRSTVLSRIADRARNLILSFFASTTGFLAQKLADELGIPHVASVRGSDLNIYACSPEAQASLQHVFARAAGVVTTNAEQASTVRRQFDRSHNLRTVYNLAPAPRAAERRLGRGHMVRLFSDTGLSYKKGSHVLLPAVDAFLSAHPNASFHLVGEVGEEPAFWSKAIEKLAAAHPHRVQAGGHLDPTEVERLRNDADIYVHASLAEGCSSGRLKAIASGMAVASSQTGELRDRPALPLLFPCAAGSVSGLTEAMASAYRAVKSTSIDELQRKHTDASASWLAPMQPREVRNGWEAVINTALPKHDNVPKTGQPRVLLFSHDGTGLGHLRRLCRIASSLQGPMTTLVVSGHASVGDIIDPACEFVHIPSLDSLVRSRARYWGRAPFIDLPLGEAYDFRADLLHRVVEWFRPDAIVMDFLPFGKNLEMEHFIQNYRCKKYYVLRGVLDDFRNVRVDVLGGRGEQALEEKFDRILVTCDERIIDVAEEYQLSAKIAAKVTYVGYVAPSASGAERRAIRANRGLEAGQKWVVCSAGGGKLSERLIAECLELAKRHPDVAFDVVCGYRSALSAAASKLPSIDGNLWIHRSTPALPELHQSADVVVCSAGYNSMVETMAGGAHLICVPVQLETDDEQFIHGQRVGKYYALSMVTSLHQLEEKVIGALGSTRGWHDETQRLALNGASSVRNVIYSDFGITR